MAKRNKRKKSSENCSSLDELLGLLDSQISKLKKKQKFKWALVGGLAIYTYLGEEFGRDTKDADVIICVKDKSQFRKILENSGFSCRDGVYSKKFGDYTIEIWLISDSDEKSLEYSAVNNTVNVDGTKDIRVPKVAQLFVLKLSSYIDNPGRPKDLSDALKLLMKYKEEIKTQLIRWISKYQHRYKNSWMEQYGTAKSSTGKNIYNLINRILKELEDETKEKILNMRDKSLVRSAREDLIEIKNILETYCKLK